MPDLSLRVDGMGCRGCVREVTARLRDVQGVDRVVADAARHEVALHGSMSVPDVLAALAGTTFVAHVLSREPDAVDRA